MRPKTYLSIVHKERLVEYREIEVIWLPYMIPIGEWLRDRIIRPINLGKNGENQPSLL